MKLRNWFLIGVATGMALGVIICGASASPVTDAEGIASGTIEPQTEIVTAELKWKKPSFDEIASARLVVEVTEEYKALKEERDYWKKYAKQQRASKLLVLDVARDLVMASDKNLEERSKALENALRQVDLLLKMEERFDRLNPEPVSTEEKK